MKKAVSSYIQLTKPSIMLLVLVTGATALIWEGSLVAEPGKFFLVMLALFLTGGAANALNQFFERDIDAQMGRTMARRPLPLQKLKPSSALAFSITIGVVGVAIFAFWFNWLAAVLSLMTILFYSLVYTLLLKPNTAQNIVVGGAAGAMAPVGAWAAASGQMALAPWMLFLIVFLWTPPHFWALALYCKDDYARVRLPMMPLVRGDRSTLNQMLVYAVLLFLSSVTPLLFGAGIIYAMVALPLGGLFLWKMLQARRSKTTESLRALFGFSIVYLLALFVGLIVDVLILSGLD